MNRQNPSELTKALHKGRGKQLINILPEAWPGAGREQLTVVLARKETVETDDEGMVVGNFGMNLNLRKEEEMTATLHDGAGLKKVEVISTSG